MTDYIDKQVREITESVMSSNPSAREIAVAIEANQMYADYLEQVLDAPAGDNGVMVSVDGTLIRFKDTEDFSSWLVELL